jgi:hypothetical protein
MLANPFSMYFNITLENYNEEDISNNRGTFISYFWRVPSVFLEIIRLENRACQTKSSQQQYYANAQYWSGIYSIFFCLFVARSPQRSNDFPIRKINSNHSGFILFCQARYGICTSAGISAIWFSFINMWLNLSRSSIHEK